VDRPEPDLSAVLCTAGDRNSQDQWVLAPIANTVNETLLNGQAITAPILLSEGDTIAVGRSAKGIIKMPVAVRGR